MKKQFLPVGRLNLRTLLLIGGFIITTNSFSSHATLVDNSICGSEIDIMKQKVSLKVKNKSLRYIFEELEGKTSYLFVYYDSLSDLEKKVTLECKNKSIQEVLDMLFEDTDLSYTIDGRQIVVKQQERKAQEEIQKDIAILVDGIVVNELGEPLPGVGVVVKGETRGVLTDINGGFRIELEKKETLTFTYLGYQSAELVFSKNARVRVELRPKIDELSEVTVVAFGTQKKESVIGAITTVAPSLLQNPVGKISTSLAGQMAGIVAVQRSGEPGAGADFWIRGISTFSQFNRPLVLVDGIERSLDLVDAEDIESFSILKDATATAVYGVRGANGIVLVTTKKGKEGKFNIKAKAEIGILSPIRMPKLADGGQWIDYYNDINYDSTGRIIYSDEVKAKYLNGSDPDLYPNVDWMKEIYRNTTMSQRVNINITGGSKRLRYYVAGAFYNENGIFDAKVGKEYNPSLRYSRYNFRANIDMDVTSSTEVSLHLANLYEVKNRPGNDVIWNQTLTITPIALPVRYSDGTLAQSSIAQNPWNILNKSGYSNDFWNTSQSLVSITQDFSEMLTKGLKMNVKFAWDAVNSTTLDRRKYPTTYYATGRDENGKLVYHQNNEGSDYISLTRTNSGSRTISFESSVTYENDFANTHHVGGLLLFNQREYTNNFPVDYIASFANRNIGMAFRATYSYRDKYFTEVNFGYNGSENFAPGKKFGFFPSLAVGYLISNETYFEKLKQTISLLKLKASHGKIGNDKIGGNRRFAFNSEMKWTDRYGSYVFGSTGQNYVGGLTTGHPGNMDVSWEIAKKTNIGIELGLFDKFSLSTDFFYEKRDRIFIIQQNVPSVVGQNVQEWVNVGRMKNQGIDGSFNYAQTLGNVFVQARANFVFNRNKKLYDDKPTPVWSYREEAGFVDEQQRGLVALGLFKDEEDISNSPKQGFGTVRPGDIKYRDINGDGLVDSGDVIAIGRTDIPEVNYGFGFSSAWNGFDLSLFFQGTGNVTRFIGEAPIYGQEGHIQEIGQIYADVVENRWSLSNPDPNAKYPRMSMIWNRNNNQYSTLYQRDVSFIRLKNAEVGYQLPKKITKKLGASSVRFFVQGVNLLTFSKFDLWDPELDGAHGNSYPQMKIVSFGVNINI